MPFPGSLTTITVNIDFTGTAGLADSGTVEFAPPVDVLYPNFAVLSRTPQVATIVNGIGSIQLVTTDNASLNPSSWGYTVTINLEGLTFVYAYTGVGIPSTYGSSVNLATVLPPSVPTPIVPNTYGVLAQPNVWVGQNTFDEAIVAPNVLEMLDAKGSGATGNGTTDDTAALNTLLTNAAGGAAWVGAGTYKISAPLVIHSNTLLWCAPDAVFNLVAASQCNMIQNAAVTPQRTITDAAMTSGSTTLTSPSQANWTSADVGRSVNVAGAFDTAGHVLTATILTVTSATAVVLNTAAGNTVSGASCPIYNRDSNFTVAGGVWNRGNNGWNSVAASPNLTTMQFKHCDGWTVRDLQLTTAFEGYELHCGDVTGFTIRNIAGATNNTVVNTDLVNVHAPAQGGLIDNVRGFCGDDFVSIHSLDGNTNLQDTVGNCTDIVVTNLFPVQNGQAAFKIHAGSTTVCSSITARGIHGSSLAGGVHLEDYATPTSQSILDDILIDDVDVTTSTGTGLVNIYCNNAAGQITLRNLVWRYNTGFASVVYVMPGTTLGVLTVSGVTIDAGNNIRAILVGGASGASTTVGAINLSGLAETTSAATSVTGVQVDSTFATVHNVFIENAQCFKDTNAQQGLCYNKGNIDTLTITGAFLSNGGLAFGTTSAAAAMTVLLSNITLESAYQLAQVASAVNLVMNGVNVPSITGGPLIFISGSTAALTVRGRGLLNPNNYALFTTSGGPPAPRVIHREAMIDVALCALTLGDQAYNTNAASAVGGATGPVQCDGSYWYSVIQKPINGGIVSGQYSLPDGGAPSSTATFATGQFRAYPVYIGPGAPIERIWAEVTTVGDATSLVHLGVYADNGSWEPGALFIDAGTINGDSATVQEIVLGSPVQPTPGWYWVGAACVFTTTSPTVRTLTSSAPVQFPLGSTLPAAGTVVSGVYMTGVTSGALPSTWTTAGVAGSCPRIGFKGH